MATAAGPGAKATEGRRRPVPTVRGSLGAGRRRPAHQPAGLLPGPPPHRARQEYRILALSGTGRTTTVPRESPRLVVRRCDPARRLLPAQHRAQRDGTPALVPREDGSAGAPASGPRDGPRHRHHRPPGGTSPAGAVRLPVPRPVRRVAPGRLAGGHRSRRRPHRERRDLAGRPVRHHRPEATAAARRQPDHAGSSELPNIPMRRARPAAAGDDDVSSWATSARSGPTDPSTPSSTRWASSPTRASHWSSAVSDHSRTTSGAGRSCTRTSTFLGWVPDDELMAMIGAFDVLRADRGP